MSSTHRSLNRITALAVGLGLGLGGVAAAQEISLVQLDDPYALRAEARAVSADGALTVGWVYLETYYFDDGECVDENLPHGAAWAAGGGLLELRGLGPVVPECDSNAETARAHAVSPDGLVVAGSASDESGVGHSSLWVNGDVTPIFLPSDAYIEDVANDRTVVGYSFDDRPVVSRGGGTFAELESVLGRAQGVSADGSHVVGYVALGAKSWIYTAVQWTWDGSGWTRNEIAGEKTQAEAISADGTSIVGGDYSGAEGRFFVLRGGFLEDFPHEGAGSPNAVSNDGDRVAFDQHIWDRGIGLRSIATMLEDAGVLPAGWDPEELNFRAMSDDGTVLVGHYRPASGARIAIRVTIPRSAADTDGDGLLDDWEENGIPYVDGAGVDQRYELPGADPDRKDLYVEIDVMDKMAQPSLQPVIEAFAAKGITLHAAYDEVVPHTPMMTGAPAPAMTEEFPEYRANYFGTAAEHGDPGSGSNPELLAARTKAYRYCLFADSSTNDALGQAESIHGNNFIIYVGVATTNDTICASCTTAEKHLLVQTTFMHELGHCLGLLHGGNENVNYKPNYVSVMNYCFQVPFRFGGQQWSLDYSSGVLPPIAEDDLDESAPFSHPSLAGRRTWYAINPCTTSDCEPNEVDPVPYGIYAFGAPQFDFDDDRVISSSTCLDLNYYGDSVHFPFGNEPTPCEPLADHDDWSNLRLELREGAPLPGEEIVEMTTGQIAAILDAMPEPCRGDVAPAHGDGTVGIEDLLLVLASWGACDGCAADHEPFTVPDGTVDVADLLVLLANWGACR